MFHHEIAAVEKVDTSEDKVYSRNIEKSNQKVNS